jgi:hypothetical protein
MTLEMKKGRESKSPRFRGNKKFSYTVNKAGAYSKFFDSASEVLQ